MGLLTSAGKFILGRRLSSIDHFSKNPLKFQFETLKYLLTKAQNTQYGKKHFFKEIKSYVDFKNNIPVVNYEDFFSEISKVLSGAENIIWPEKFKWFAKSSGTTNDKSKFIPVSDESLKKNHLSSGKDLLSQYINNYSSGIFDGYSVALGGSRQLVPHEKNKNIFVGDISAVLLKNLPFWAQSMRTPNLDVAMMPDWEEKIKLMAKITSKKNVTSLSGVPTWTIVLIKEILKNTGASSILDIWPNLELFIHGAVSFVPYKQVFNELIPAKKMNYLETYNASEGFFAYQSDLKSDSMLLLTNHGIFYEFEDIVSGSICDLSGVELEKNYALIISSCSGLWRYRIGDTIEFKSLSPYKLILTGRTKHFINAFGEELMVSNADKAIATCCKKLNCSFYNYTAGPIFMSGNKRGGHEWIVEFINPPENSQIFTRLLDDELKKINTDYEAKRYKDIALKKPKIHFVNNGFFDLWLKNKKKLGGQNKIPRLSNDRRYLDELLKLIKDFQ